MNLQGRYLENKSSQNLSDDKFGIMCYNDFIGGIYQKKKQNKSRLKFMIFRKECE